MSQLSWLQRLEGTGESAVDVQRDWLLRLEEEELRLLEAITSHVDTAGERRGFGSMCVPFVVRIC